MSKRTPKMIAEDMLTAVNRCLKYTKGFTFERFCLDSQMVDAVLRCFTVLGEASNQMPESVRSRYSNLPWHQIRGFRNRIAHEYFDLNLERVWDILQNYLPDLKLPLEKMLHELSVTEKDPPS